MSEAIATINAEFEIQENAVGFAGLMKKNKMANLHEIATSDTNSFNITSNIDNGWVLTKIKRKKNNLCIELTGPPSGGEFDGFIEWLTHEGANTISGEIICTSADIEPMPFKYFAGVEVNPLIDINGFLKKFSKEGKLTSRNGVGMTPLHSAAEMGNVELAKALLQLGADVNDPITEERGQTPLYYAIYNNCYEMAEFLIDNGSKIPKEPERQGAMVDRAILNCSEKMTNLLIDRGFSLGKYVNKFNINESLILEINDLFSELLSQELKNCEDQKRVFSYENIKKEIIERYNSDKVFPLFGGGIWDEDRLYITLEIAKALKRKEVKFSSLKESGYYIG